MEDKLKFEEYFKNWLNKSMPESPLRNFMKETLEYGNKVSDNLLKAKANRIYIKCLRAKKLQLADKIATKYRLNEIKDDSVMAMTLSMMAIKNRSDGK